MKILAFALLVVACGGKREQPELKRDDDHPRRVIEPGPAKSVRALPPYVIRQEGIGPFKLGETVKGILDQLPSGPRITQFAIPNLVHRDILRAEEDAILIGVEPQGKAMFVGVVRGEIARTEAGVHVGSTRDELVRAHGALLDDPDRAFDPHIVVASGLKNVHSLLDGDRIAAIVVAAEDKGKEIVGETACTRPRGNLEHRFGACLTGSGEIIHYDTDEGKLEVLAKNGDTILPPVPIGAPRAQVPVPNLAFAAALRNPSDGRDDIIAITRQVDVQTRTWGIVVFRPNDKGVLARVIDAPGVFQLTAANARWIGAELRDVDIYVEVTGRADALEVGGLLTTRVGNKIRDIVVISPIPVPRRRAKSAGHEDAGTSDGAR